jgi:hypothetical protein
MEIDHDTSNCHYDNSKPINIYQITCKYNKGKTTFSKFTLVNNTMHSNTMSLIMESKSSISTMGHIILLLIMMEQPKNLQINLQK